MTDMTLDDDSLLSAYMDGQLDPEQQQSVESALISDPQLAETLRSLTVLREVLGGLSCDASVDVAGPVMARIRWKIRLRTFRAAALGPAPARHRWAPTAGLIAIAAGLLIVLNVT